MIRKLLLFVVLLAGGFYLLMSLTEGPIWKKTSEEDETRVTQVPPSGVVLESDKKGQVDKPQVRVSGTGSLTLKGSPITYEIGEGHQLDLPGYVLTAKDHRIRNNGIYDLEDVLIEFLRPMLKGGRVVGGAPVSLRASSMRVTIETEGEVQRLDKSQEMDFFDVVLRSRMGKMQKGVVHDEESSESLQLECAKISGYFRDEILDLYTKDEKEKVTVVLQSNKGRARMSGLGLRGTVQTGDSAKEEFSEIRLLEDIEIVGTGDFGINVTGKGPLMVKGGRSLDWFLELANEVRISVKKSLGADRPLLEGSGDRVRIWIGFTELLARGQSRPGRSVSDLSLQGRPARMTFGNQIMESRQIHVALNDRGEPERMATDGLTRLWLRDQLDRPIGKFRGRDGILWTREGRQAGQMLGGMGIDFLGSALALVDPFWPEDVIQILGPAAYESETDSRGLVEGVEKATAEGGLLIYAAWRYGNLHPFLFQGLGNVRIRGRLQQEGVLIARGNRGFTLMREMASGVVRGAMGQAGGEDGHVFQVKMDRHAADPQEEEGRLVDIVEGEGWVRFFGNQAAIAEGRTGTMLDVKFHAGLQKNLSWVRTQLGNNTSVDGIKFAGYQQSGSESYSLQLEGIPLVLTSTEQSIRAEAEFCVKKSGEPWSLRGLIRPVDFTVGGADKRSQANLKAEVVRFRRIPVMDPDATKPLLLPIQAKGKVRLEVDFPESNGKRQRIELDCDVFRFLPILAAPALEDITSGMFGPGGSLIANHMLGNRRGFVRALGSVKLQLLELGGERGRDLRRMFGEDLSFETDSFSSCLLPKEGGLVRVEIEEEHRDRLWARAEIARTHGSALDLGAKGGGRVEIWLQDRKDPDQVFQMASGAPVTYRSDVVEPRVLPEDCGETPGQGDYRGRYGIVEFPGPVTGKQLNTRVATQFQVSCSERLILQLRTVSRSVDSGKSEGGHGDWVLPQGFDRLLAKGQVHLLYHLYEARGDALGLAGESGWFRLSSQGKRPVLLGFADEYHAKYHPGISYNLRTGEEKAGRFLIKSGPMPTGGGDR